MLTNVDNVEQSHTKHPLVIGLKDLKFYVSIFEKYLKTLVQKYVNLVWH